MDNNVRESWVELQRALRFQPRSHGWAKLEIALGLIASGIGILTSFALVPKLCLGTHCSVTLFREPTAR